MKKIFASVLVALMLLSLCSCGELLEPPKIKEAEFDFTVTYSVDGELHTISGVYVCEYAGVSLSVEGGDFSRDWVGHVEGIDVESANKYLVKKTGDGGNVYIGLDLVAAVFMGEPGIGDGEPQRPYLFVEYTDENNESAYTYGDDELIEEEFGVKIISYEYDEPIVNSYGLFK